MSHSFHYLWKKAGLESRVKYISAYENNELVGAFSGLVYEFPKTDQPELNVPHSTMKNIILVLEQAEEPLDKYFNENATPGDKFGS